MPKIVQTIASKFIPGANVLSTVYNTLQWVSQNLEQFQGLLGLGGTILNRIEGVANGDQTQMTGLANDVTTFLNNAIQPALSFGAAQLGLSSLPKDLAKRLRRFGATR